MAFNSVNQTLQAQSLYNQQQLRAAQMSEANQQNGTGQNQAQQAQSLMNQQALEAAQLSQGGPSSGAGPAQAQQMNSLMNQQALEGAQISQAAAQAPQAGDAAEVSSEASAAPAEKPQNPYEGVADNFSTVTVDPWKKGKNDTVEGMLRAQGYSLKDIYSKDKSGKTLIDHVAKANNLKNPNLIQDGAQLKVPSRAETKSMSSADLQNGQTAATEVSNKEAGVAIDSTLSKDDKGAVTLDQATENKNNADTNLNKETSVGEGGRIDTSASKVEGGVQSNTVAMNKNGSAINEERVEATGNGTTASIKDIDRGGDNLSGTATNDAVSVTNPGTNGAGNVSSKVDYSEKGSDGTLERAGGWVNGKVGEFFGSPQPAPQAPVNFNGAGQVDVSRNQEGQATVSSNSNGKSNTLLKTAGDTDDSWIERAGEWGDERLSDLGSFVGGLFGGDDK